MEFRECQLCHKEKTKRQMSLRDPRLCKSCMMSVSKDDKISIAHSPVLYNATYTPKTSQRERKPVKTPEVKEQVKASPKPVIKRPLSKMGFTKIKTPTLPKIRSHMPEFGRLSDEEKRKILAAEYKFKKMTETR